MNPDELEALALRCESGKGFDNALEVLIEVAKFKPNRVYSTCRANSAGTKVIYTDHAGHDITCWADEWTTDRNGAARMLRALAKDASHD